MAMTREERSALARIRGVVRAGGAVLGPEGLDMWRPRGCEEYQAGAEEIGHALEVLGVEHTIGIAPRPSYRSAKRTPAMGFLVRVEWRHLPALRERIPAALDPLIEAVDAPTES